MGLDVSHDCFSGPYSAFNRFREELCRVVGLNMASMEEFKLPAPFIAAERPPVQTKWELLKPDPLWTLINHSDCDGEIAWDDCGLLSQRLRELAPLLPEDIRGVRELSLRETAEKFAAGLIQAWNCCENVKFG